MSAPTGVPDPADARRCYLSLVDLMRINTACLPLSFGDGHVGTFLVGSALRRRDYRDVDVRAMVHDEEFDAMFATRPEFWSTVCLTTSEYLRAATGLPIDFQVQRMSDANRDYPTAEGHERNPVGIESREYAGGLR